MLKLSDYNVTFYDSADKVVCSCSYNDREIAKDLGFFWDKENKIWAMERKYFIHLIPYIKRNYNIEDNSYAVEVEGNEIIYCKFARMPVVVLISEPYAEAVICPFKYKDELKELGFTWEPALKLWVMDSYDFECFADDYPELFIDTNDVSGISLEYNDLLHVDEFLDIEENTDIDLGKALSLLKKDVVPYGYQKEGISYILSKKYCLLTDEMGLGKSLQALTSSLPYIDNKVLVICPAFLKYNWRAEYLKFSNVPEKRILLAKNKKEVGTWDTNNYDVLIINYEMLRSGVLNDIFNDFGMVILDECHYLKEPTAQRTESFLYLMEQHKPEFLIGLTGTPVQNRVPEFYTLLKLMSMCPSKTNGKKITDSFMTYSSFCERFSYKKLKKFRGMRQAVVKYEGSKNIKELKEYLKGKFIRRMAEDHLDLPEFSHQNILVELTKKALNEISESLRQAWEEQVIDSEGDEEESFSTAKARAALAKAPAVVNFTDDLLQQEPDSPVVIFSDHRESVDFMFEALSKKKKSVARIYGGTPNAKRHKIVEDFQAGKLDVLVATIGAAGTGLTLTKSNKMIFCDLNWVPGQNAQAEKRIHRVGQKNRCMYYHFILPGIDEMISSSLQEKIETINKVI